MILIQTCFDSDPTKHNSFNHVYMYIPIGPSKKQLYKIIIGLLLLCYLLFLGMYKPKALSDSINIPRSSSQGGTYSTSGSGYFDFPAIAFSSGSRFAGYRDGFVTFSVGISGRYEVYSIEVYGTDSRSSCNIGDNSGYNDNTTQFQLYSATCYIDFAAQPSSRLSGLIIHGFSHGGTIFATFSEYITYYSQDTNKEVIAAINNINNSSVQQQIALNNINNNISSVNNNTNDIKDSLNDSSIDSSSANDLTNNSAFQDSNGLDAIIKAPLNFIQSLTSSTCSSISLTIPYINADVILPCMSTIYNKALGQQLVNLIALVINGVVLYRYCLKILQIVKDAKNPNKDGLEVLDL